jgi:V8-like Glu-specific endopeptidase
MIKYLLVLCLIVTSLTAQAKRKIIYGKDNRKDISSVHNKSIQKLSKSVAARVNNFSFKSDSNRSISFPTPQFLTSSWTLNLCEDEKFSNQPAMADCTGFLVGRDLIATAGHCVTDGTRSGGTSGFGVEYCQSHSWLFDYKTDSSGEIDLSEMNKNNLYRCKEVIKAKLFGEEDFAIIRLDREVTGRKPLRLRSTGKIKVGQKLFVIGHPSGLPMKYADGAKVFGVFNPYFSTNLDTFGGNSGSPVFNTATNEVEGILVRGDSDYLMSSHNGASCTRVNVCNNDRQNCLDNDPNIDGEHVTKISRIKEYLK